MARQFTVGRSGLLSQPGFFVLFCFFFFGVGAPLENEGQGTGATWETHEDRVQDFL